MAANDQVPISTWKMSKPPKSEAVAGTPEKLQVDTEDAAVAVTPRNDNASVAGGVYSPHSSPDSPRFSPEFGTYSPESPTFPSIGAGISPLSLSSSSGAPTRTQTFLKPPQGPIPFMARTSTDQVQASDRVKADPIVPESHQCKAAAAASLDANQIKTLLSLASLKAQLDILGRQVYRQGQNEADDEVKDDFVVLSSYYARLQDDMCNGTLRDPAEIEKITNAVGRMEKRVALVRERKTDSVLEARLQALEKLGLCGADMSIKKSSAPVEATANKHKDHKLTMLAEAAALHQSIGDLQTRVALMEGLETQLASIKDDQKELLSASKELLALFQKKNAENNSISDTAASLNTLVKDGLSRYTAVLNSVQQALDDAINKSGDVVAKSKTQDKAIASLNERMAALGDLVKAMPVGALSGKARQARAVFDGLQGTSDSSDLTFKKACEQIALSEPSHHCGTCPMCRTSAFTFGPQGAVQPNVKCFTAGHFDWCVTHQAVQAKNDGYCRGARPFLGFGHPTSFSGKTEPCVTVNGVERSDGQ